MSPPSEASRLSIGERLRHQRIEVLGKGLRETARLLDVAPAHLTDLEKDRRTPSEALLLRIARVYDIDEATLRSGWGKADVSVGEIASRSPTTAAKAPELLRAASDLSAEQWDSLIEQARSMAAKVKRRSSRTKKSS